MTVEQIRRKSDSFIQKLKRVSEKTRKLNTGEADRSFAKNVASLKKELLSTNEELWKCYNRQLAEVQKQCNHPDKREEDVGQGIALVCADCKLGLEFG